ncbi:MAG: outer membrane protein transport protein [Candidatus Marinimicrobia bacterium]|nr:outer membrane protein transport protein [Candidatus Neomarinimicrobiota bacterium]
MRRKIIYFAVAAAAACASTVQASGYRIPEQSLNSTALSSAYVANAFDADAAYYNPANMSWMYNGTSIEGGLTFINLPSVSYRDNRTPTYNGDSEKENFLIPNFYFVSKDYNNFRFGMAVVFPAGLAKQWEDPFPKTFAEEFSMTVAEANPSVSYKFNDMFSAAVGARMLYGEATVKSQGTVIAVPAGGLGGGVPPTDEYTYISRELEGDTIEAGYNLALTIRPTDKLNLAATYRSKVDMDMEGDGTLSASGSFPNGIIPGAGYQGSGDVSVPVPAVLALAVSYSFEKATVEFEYDRTYWSAYEQIDINYSRDLYHPVLTTAFDNPVPKNWDDVDAFRLGLTYSWNDNLKLMGGAGIDGNPIPVSTLSFDLPDSDAWFLSFGFRYKMEDISFGAAYLYAQKDDRTVVNSALNGEFTDGSSHLLSASVAYQF